MRKTYSVLPNVSGAGVIRAGFRTTVNPVRTAFSFMCNFKVSLFDKWCESDHVRL